LLVIANGLIKGTNQSAASIIRLRMRDICFYLFLTFRIDHKTVGVEARNHPEPGGPDVGGSPLVGAASGASPNRQWCELCSSLTSQTRVTVLRWKSGGFASNMDCYHPNGCCREPGTQPGACAEDRLRG